MVDPILTNGCLGKEKIEVKLHRDKLIVNFFFFPETEDRAGRVARRDIIGVKKNFFLGNVKSKQICR